MNHGNEFRFVVLNLSGFEVFEEGILPQVCRLQDYKVNKQR
jgi:hypothetical protein